MLLAIDIGNSRITGGLFPFDAEVDRGRKARNSSGEAKLVTHGSIPVASMEKIKRNWRRVVPARYETSVKAVAIADVNPPLRRKLRTWLKKKFGAPVHVVGQDLPIGMRIKCDEPGKVGADRLVNAVAAFERTHRETIIVDVGTAITVDVVSAKGEFLGGAIAPGVEMAAWALHERTQLLPLVKPAPGPVIGKNTREAVSAGVFWGTAALVDGLVRQIARERRSKSQVVATGGNAHLIVPHCKSIRRVCESLTLEGISAIFYRAKSLDTKRMRR